MQLESLIYILYTYLITIYIDKSNKYLNFHGRGKKNHYYNNHLCAYPIILYKKITYISIHMGTKKTKKITIIIFNLCKFIECQNYHDIKGLVICMFSDYAHIDHIDYNEMCTYPFHQKEFLLSLVFLLGALFQVVTQLCTNMIRYYLIYFISNWINTL